MDDTRDEGRGGLRLGTFLGVFTPTILTILGVIMYLRSGWVVANAGLAGTIAIVVFANAITFLSALSMSALATNMRVGVGGAYFLISRTLGVEVGGAIGIPLYLSQALSVTLYAYGLSESMVAIAGMPEWLSPWMAAAIIVGVGTVAARSTELTLKLQLPIMALIAASLVSLLLGVDGGTSTVPALGPWTDGGFFAIFAVFFPAVTGILAGVSMSGDLEDPGRSIPTGVMSAVAVGFVIYLIVPVALAYGAVSADLRDPMVWLDIAAVPALVVPGMWGAILSSAFGSILGAPRTLQALAMDDLVPSWLGQLDEETGEPIAALRFTTAVAVAAVALGALNTVAAVLTMFFLTTYGMLNLVAGLETLVADPGFRPRIRVPWQASLLGAVGCAIGMLAIHPGAALVAMAVEGTIYFALRRRSMEATWGDVRSGMWLTAARYALLALRDVGHDPRGWRPHILMFTKDLSSAIDVAHVASDFSQDRGIVTVSTLLIGDVDEHDQAEQVFCRDRALLEDHGILAFPEVVAVPAFEAGVITVAQANGFAGLASNTVLFGWAEVPAQLATLIRLSRKLERLERCTLIVRPGPTPTDTHPTAVVWWGGLEHNGDLMLLLAHLLSLSEHWRTMKIVLKSIVDGPAVQVQRERDMLRLVSEARLDVSVDVIVQGNEPVDEILRAHSRKAAVVFFGLSRVPAGSELAYARHMQALAEGLPTTIFVRNAGPFRGRLVGAPEDLTSPGV